MVKKLILCICGKVNSLLDKCISILEAQYGSIDILGKLYIDILSGGCSVSYKDDGLTEEEIKRVLCNYFLILGDEDTNRSIAVRYLNSLGVDRELIIPDKVVCLPGFTLGKYNRVLTEHITIFSNNCAAGFMYNLFCMPFYSPTINMYQNNDSFLRFASRPFWYLSKELEFEGFERNDNLEYPVFRLDDVVLHMNHYTDRLNAEKKWYKRLGRINPDNMLFMMYTDKSEELALFHMLPYAKKVCFVPFQAKLPDAYPIPPIDRLAHFWQLVLAVVDGSLECYDLWDMLLEGKKTQIMDF